MYRYSHAYLMLMLMFIVKSLIYIWVTLRTEAACNSHCSRKISFGHDHLSLTQRNWSQVNILLQSQIQYFCQCTDWLVVQSVCVSLRADSCKHAFHAFFAVALCETCSAAHSKTWQVCFLCNGSFLLTQVGGIVGLIFLAIPIWRIRDVSNANQSFSSSKPDKKRCDINWDTHFSLWLVSVLHMIN